LIPCDATLELSLLRQPARRVLTEWSC